MLFNLPNCKFFDVDLNCFSKKRLKYFIQYLWFSKNDKKESDLVGYWHPFGSGVSKLVWERKLVLVEDGSQIGCGNLFLRGHPIRITHIPSIYRMRNEIQSAKDHLHFSFIEPNTHLVSKSGFFEDKELFCLALGLDKKIIHLRLESFFIRPGTNSLRVVQFIFKAKDTKI